MKTAFNLLDYCRRTLKKKGFLDNPAVKEERLIFARQGLFWTRSRLQVQIFMDEIWALGGAYTPSYVTVKKDGSAWYFPDNLQHKYSKAPAWIFYGVMVGYKKCPTIFWEKEWGSITSACYDLYILSEIQTYMEANSRLIFIQDNAISHQS